MIRIRRIVAASLALALPASNVGAATCTVPKIPAITHSGATLNKQTFHLLDKAKYPDALCNDGSAGGYLFRPGSGLGVQRWVFYLQGGGQCESNTDCKARPAGLTGTGLVTGSGPAMGGIVSSLPSINPDFYDANAVQVLYCSSDLWSGDKAPTAPFKRGNAQNTWYFRGRAIAMAALQDLTGAGINSATEILFTGSSAGGEGIIVTANDLRPLAPPSARILFADDAGFTLDIGAYDPSSPGTGYVSTATPTPGEIILGTGHLFWGGRGDKICDSMATTPHAVIECYNSANIITAGYVAPPVAVAQALDDVVQLGDDGLPRGRPKPGTPEAGYAASFASAMSTALQGMGTYNSAYGPYAFLHELLTGNKPPTAFGTPHSFPAPYGSVTPSQAVGAWYVDPCNAQKLIGTTLEPARFSRFGWRQ